MTTPAELSRERLTFTVFLAILLHAMVILGVTFKAWQGESVPPTLEITLAQYENDRSKDKADYLAQHNQEASGTLDKKAELTSDTHAEFADTQIRNVEELEQFQATTIEPVKGRQVISTVADSKVKSRKKPEEDRLKEQAEIKAEQEMIVQRQEEIASLQAKLDQQRQRYAKRPRIKTLTSVATKKSSDAEYLYHWQEKIEMVGNLNYPPEARRQKIFGNLRLLVTVLPNGAVYDTEILQSSGHRMLDEAALRIVRLAAPFEPFPPEMKREVDRLEIIRTWKFEKSGRFVNE